MSVPYAAFPKYGPDVLGQAKYDAEMKAWKEYQDSLKRKRPQGEEENENEPGENLNTYTYIRKYTKTDQSRKRIFREQGIRAHDKHDAMLQGRDAMEAELGPPVDDRGVHWHGEPGSEKVVKPRGKSFEDGQDERRNETGTNGHDDAESEESQGDGDGSEDGEGDGDCEEGEGGSGGEGEDDDTPKMPTCPDCGQTRGSTEGCCAPEPPKEMPKPEQSDKQPDNDLQLLRTGGQAPLENTEAGERVMDLAHIDTIDTLGKSLGDVGQWTRALVQHDVHALATELYEAMTKSHLSLKKRIATMQPKVGVSRTVLEETVKKAAAGIKIPENNKSPGITMQEAREVARKLIDDHMLDSIATIAELVAEHINAPRRIEVSVNGKVKEITGTPHKCFDESLRAMQRGLDVFMVGPAGSGKGFLAQHLAEALDQRFGFISCSEGMSEGMLLGRGVPLADRFLYLQSSFVDFYENGGVFLLDEIDAANPNVLLIINECLSSPHLSIPNRVENPYATRHEHFYAIVAANTWGTGPNMEYVGRNRLDAAFLNRFVGSQIELEYDVRVEGEIAKSYLGAEDAGDVLKRFWNIRKKLADLSIRRVWSTRGLQKMCIAIAAGDKMATVLDAHTAGWTPDEKSKAGIK